MGLLVGTILFAFGYWGFYEVASAAPGPKGEWQAQSEALKQWQLAHQTKSDDDTLAALAKEGEAVFQSTCVACHGAQAQGVIGPNLTDDYWLHGGKPGDIRNTISKGFLEKGMPAWEPTLGASRVQAVTAFVLSQRGK